MNIAKTTLALCFLPVALAAQVQPIKNIPDAVRVIRDTVRPEQPGLVSFRVIGAAVPPNTWANLGLTLKSSDPAAPAQVVQYQCNATETLFICPIVSQYGRPSGFFEISSITLISNTNAGQATRTFKAGADFRTSSLTIDNPKAPQPPNLDGLKIDGIDVESGR